MVAKNQFVGIPQFDKIIDSFNSLRTLKRRLSISLAEIKEDRIQYGSLRKEIVVSLKYLLEAIDEFEDATYLKLPKQKKTRKKSKKSGKKTKKASKKSPKKVSKEPSKSEKKVPEKENISKAKDETKKQKIKPTKKPEDFTSRIQSLRDEFEKIKKELKE
jgi:hypothetical protein